MSVLQSTKKVIVPIHKEGWVFIAIAAVLSIILGWLWSPLFWIGMVMTGWICYFFRDPPRVIPTKDGLIVSPADGVVSGIGLAYPPKELELGSQPLMRVSIFMNVLNCHVNRAPIGGKVVKLAYTKGKFFNAELDKASEQNERNGLVIHSSVGYIGVVQIAGLVARRIVCFIEEKDEISIGDRFGLIRFGSRVDVYLPDETKVQVSMGQTMIAGETVITDLRVSDLKYFPSRVS